MRKKNSNKKCLSMKNTTTMDKCDKIVLSKKKICGIHNRRKYIYLSDGSIRKNNKKLNLLSSSNMIRPPILFWSIINNGISLEKLNQKYSPDSVSRLRVEKVSYLRNELQRLGVNTHQIESDRYYWLLYLLYYLGNFQLIVKKIQRFYRGPFKKKLEKRKIAIKTISRCYLHYKFKKLLPILVYNGKCLKRHNCINLCDPVTQETFMDIPPERWVICNNGEIDNCWWFDIASAVQLLGSPGSYSGNNPFNRKEYPSEYLFDIEEKMEVLSEKYEDIKNLSLSSEELKNVVNIENLPSESYSYERFKLHIKANRFFESLKELGYTFPRNIFLEYSLGELRILAAKLYECWNISNDEERIRIFPPNGNIYPDGFSSRIMTCSNSTYLKSIILNTLLKSITYQVNYHDKTYACLKSLVILGSINQRSHIIIQNNGLCDCNGNHNHENITSLEILGNLLSEFA